MNRVINRACAIPRRAPRAFVLLEVVMSLTILGMAVVAFMHSFTQSLAAVKSMDVQTQAIFFAQQLLDEMEIHPPEEGEHTGGFGDEYNSYSFWVKMEYIDPDYKRIDTGKNIERWFARREYKLEIRYDDGHTRFTPVRLDSAIVAFEKFSYPSKVSYANF